MNDIMTALMNQAFLKYKIRIILSSEAGSYTPSVTHTESRTIIINTNWHDKKQIPLQMAHEMGHIINGDKATRPVYFSAMQTDYPMELEANRTAIKLLLPFYLRDKETESVNSQEFMDAFSVPTHLENVVIKEISGMMKE
ncbi:ImmA/IrrE family metallo-endopeptidase [Levilactobacillus namurensis]|uniref:ImmA/IrrE family metallo-endopeptidase n=1 Tax=Levilactobacillus namurensis TaxID=380393 RepID=A0AAW8W9Y1_9LACO|nr:ImmA/IrrE family metallo-endopeptidase [Levilactobacillus namurensis]MDT7012828.1 ImmA/IrrE family metallo-endopeptidase [Levilactobacillus namurensis]MDT7015354.1 ImmA/IrrE family metallo-endopeptidase [Levilactobacillus namurensis]MDT7015578.1 ImmA/IrrE family metallo-endopeptidase [Levilactobacillus namurensis]